jgi:predicted metalloprotease
MRMTEFWRRMRAQFGETYADSFARDYVIAELGHRTVEEALRQGESAKDVWRALCIAMNLPASER